MSTGVQEIVNKHAGPRLAELVGPAVDAAEPSSEVLLRLRRLCEERELRPLAERLGEVAELTALDLAAVDADLRTLPSDDLPVQDAAVHLLRLPGKRLRPMCVALAGRVGEAPESALRDLAVAVELVHAATLLHDDVVDQADLRRGSPSARAIYGNAASIFAGDWLLIEAIRRVRRGAPAADVLDALLATIDKMIDAEALQLEVRGRFTADRATYGRVVSGKTAALFRWALFAGGRVGGLSPRACRALADFGEHLGTAFQVVDDVLDMRGDGGTLGKALHIDLLEGKATWPLIVALEADPRLRDVAEALLEEGLDDAETARRAAELVARIEAAGGFDAAERTARHEADAALACLEHVPAGPARAALATLCEATLRRRR